LYVHTASAAKDGGKKEGKFNFFSAVSFRLINSSSISIQMEN
jgi:hypothetical protein